MSGAVPDDLRERLDIRAEIARIDRDRAETSKLTEEAQKFIAEQRKLIAEGRKLDRDRWLAPLVAASAFGGAIIGVVLQHLWH